MNINKKNKQYAPVVIIGLSVLLAFIFVGLKKDERRSVVEEYIPTIKTFIPDRRDFKVYLEKEGHIISKYEYPIISEVHGEILYLSDYFNNNLIFEKDELLLQIDSSYYSIDRRNAKALLDAAILDNEMQHAIYKRSQIEINQYDNEDVNDLARKIPQLNSSKSKLDAAKANYERSLLNLKKTSIRAPFKGRIKRNQSSKGMIVSQGMQLATIYSIEDLFLRLPLQLDEVNFLGNFQDLENNQDLQIDVSLSIGGETYHLDGKYEGVSGAVDRLTQSVFLNVALDSFESLGLIVDNNLFVKAKVYGKRYSDIYVLPNVAIRDKNVIDVVEEGRLFNEKVEIIKIYKDSTVIKCDKLDNRTINITPLDFYVDSMKVKVVI